MKIVGIDFETANSKHDSACSIGIAVAHDGGKIDVHHYHIRPPTMHFEPHHVAIHNITPSMVRDAPTFKELYPKIDHLLKHGPLWAHNASFECSVFKALSATYHENYLMNIECTFKLAKRLFPKLESHRLNVVCEHLGLKMQHHHAGDDAWATAKIVLHCKELIKKGKWQDPIFDPFIVPKKIRGGVFAMAGRFNFGSNAQVMKAMRILGARLETKMRRNTPYLLIGEADRSYKGVYDQAIKYISNGGSIRIVKESDFWAEAKKERLSAS
jgi:DNA polymerase-3 subunit epsilon